MEVEEAHKIKKSKTKFRMKVIVIKISECGFKNHVISALYLELRREKRRRYKFS